MVDFKKALEAKEMVIRCDGFVNTVYPCHTNAACYFVATDDEENETEHHLCVPCFKKLFPKATEDDIEEAKRDLFGNNYRNLMKE